VGLLADAQHPTGKPGITELDGEAQLGQAAPMTATDQLKRWLNCAAFCQC
jgi:hypothetical protein